MLAALTSQALMACARLTAAEGKFRLVAELARELGVSRANLAKVFSTLRQKRLIESRRGYGGGVRLARAGRDVSLYDICAALDDPFLTSHCLLGRADCAEDRACPVHGFWRDAQRRMHQRLREISLAALAGSPALLARLKADG